MERGGQKGPDYFGGAFLSSCVASLDSSSRGAVASGLKLIYLVSCFYGLNVATFVQQRLNCKNAPFDDPSRFLL